jgi:hypothetical protein
MSSFAATTTSRGRDHVALVARNLRPVVKRLRVLDLASVWPDIEESQDVSDWFSAEFKKEQLLALVDGLPDWTPPAATANGHDNSRERAGLARPLLLFWSRRTAKRSKSRTK